MGKRKPLNFTKEYMNKILSGEKTSTIRLKTNLKVGEKVQIIVGGEKLGEAKIVSIKRKNILSLTDEDAKKDGFKNKKELLKALRKHYGKISPNTNVYIVGFKLE
ncbi:ASCH domain-containing protein [Candidatus Bathyarchaeota archaeon]|nr:MAG: ASCH domain-containing protein [Candidatus Bathyarchaeota archaeon]